jgi:hypothetical protein
MFLPIFFIVFFIPRKERTTFRRSLKGRGEKKECQWLFLLRRVWKFSLPVCERVKQEVFNMQRWMDIYKLAAY